MKDHLPLIVCPALVIIFICSSCEGEKPKPLIDKKYTKIEKIEKLTPEQENERLKIYFFNLANKADEGDVESQRELGTRYILGQGLVKNVEKGLPWLTKAAEGGSHSAQYSLAQMLYTGEMVEADSNSAVEWMIKAADGGLAEAQRDLAVWYLEGDKISMNIDMAMDYLEKAANQGDADSQCMLGEIYLSRSQSAQDKIEVEENTKKALEWFQAAAELKHPRALQRVKFIEENNK